MAEEKRKMTEEMISDLTDKIISNSKDSRWAREMLGQLKGLLQMDKLIDVPLKDVRETIDFGACAIHNVKDGFVFEAKGGLATHISMRMRRVCVMLQTLFDLHGKADKAEDDSAVYEAFSSAVLYIFQAPILSSLDERALFDNATAILKSFNEYCAENYGRAQAVEESETDIKDNIEMENMERAVETLANAPLPPED